jgi:WD40 repeat protein
VLFGHQPLTFCVCVSPLQTLELIKTINCPIINPTLGGNVKAQDITSASLAPNRKRFIAGGPADQAWPDPWVHVFDYESGQEVECNKGHHGHVWDVAFSPDGETYASGADDGTIRIWKTYPGAKPKAEEEAK